MPTANNLLSGESLKAFPLQTGPGSGYLFSSLLFNIVLQVYLEKLGKKKMIKGIQMRKEEVKLALFANGRILCIENLRESIKKRKRKTYN